MSRRDDEEKLVASKPHVMLISYPLQGHMNPMIQFSKRLVSEGIKVTIITTTNIETSSSLAKTTSINIEHISVDEPSVKGDSPDIINEFLVLYEICMTRSLPEVIEKQKTNGWPVKILIYDALMPWALDISHKQGIQGVAFCTHSSAVFAIYSNVYLRTLDIDSLGELSTVTLPSLPVLGIKDLPSLVYDIGTYKGLSRLVVSQFQGIEKADCVLFNTFDKLEHEVSYFSFANSITLNGLDFD